MLFPKREIKTELTNNNKAYLRTLNGLFSVFGFVCLSFTGEQMESKGEVISVELPAPPAWKKMVF